KVASRVTKRAPIAGVTLEQAKAIDGQALARVRVALTSPATYKVHSDRNVIHLDLEPNGERAAGSGRLAAGSERWPVDSRQMAAGTGLPEAGSAKLLAGGQLEAGSGAPVVGSWTPEAGSATLDAASATRLDKVRATNTKNATTVTLAGNGR